MKIQVAFRAAMLYRVAVTPLIQEMAPLVACHQGQHPLGHRNGTPPREVGTADGAAGDSQRPAQQRRVAGRGSPPARRGYCAQRPRAIDEDHAESQRREPVRGCGLWPDPDVLTAQLRSSDERGRVKALHGVCPAARASQLASPGWARASPVRLRGGRAAAATRAGTASQGNSQPLAARSHVADDAGDYLTAPASSCVHVLTPQPEPGSTQLRRTDGTTAVRHREKTRRSTADRIKAAVNHRRSAIFAHAEQATRRPDWRAPFLSVPGRTVFEEVAADKPRGG